MASPMLWGGMLVARPTAMPEEPFTNRFGKRPGSKSGSFNVSSKFRLNFTVSFSRSRSISMATGVILASVYRIAAAESPSTLPKLPWPSTMGICILNS